MLDMQPWLLVVCLLDGCCLSGVLGGVTMASTQLMVTLRWCGELINGHWPQAPITSTITNTTGTPVQWGYHRENHHPHPQSLVGAQEPFCHLRRSQLLCVLWCHRRVNLPMLWTPSDYCPHMTRCWPRTIFINSSEIVLPNKTTFE